MSLYVTTLLRSYIGKFCTIPITIVSPFLWFLCYDFSDDVRHLSRPNIFTHRKQSYDQTKQRQGRSNSSASLFAFRKE